MESGKLIRILDTVISDMKGGSCLKINSLIIVTLFLALLLAMSGLAFHTALAFHPSSSSSTSSPTSNPPTPPSNQITTPPTAGCGPGTDNSTCNQSSNPSQQLPPIGGAITPNITGGGLGGSPNQGSTTGAGTNNGNGFGSGPSSGGGGNSDNQGGFGNTNGPPYPSGSNSGGSSSAQSTPSSGPDAGFGNSPSPGSQVPGGFGSGPSTGGEGPSTGGSNNNNNGGTENSGGSNSDNNVNNGGRGNGYGNQPGTNPSENTNTYNIAYLGVRLQVPADWQGPTSCIARHFKGTESCSATFGSSYGHLQVSGATPPNDLDKGAKSELKFYKHLSMSVQSEKIMLNERFPEYVFIWGGPGGSVACVNYGSLDCGTHISFWVGNPDNNQLWLTIDFDHYTDNIRPTLDQILNSIQPISSNGDNNAQSMQSNGVGGNDNGGNGNNNNNNDNNNNDGNQPPTGGGSGGNNNQPQQTPVIPHF